MHKPGAVASFRMCAPSNPMAWPLWWLRYILLTPRAVWVIARYGKDSFRSGYEAAPLFYNVFGECFELAIQSNVKFVKNEAGEVVGLGGSPFDIGALTRLAEMEGD